MKMNLTEIVRQKWKLLVVILLLAMGNGTISYLLSSVQQPHLNELRSKWSTQRNQSAKKGTMDLAARYRQSKDDLTRLKERIPEKGEFARIVGDLLESALANSVEVSTVSYKIVPVKEEGLKSYQLTFSTRGSYAALKSYLADLQQIHELIVVDSVAFVGGDRVSDTVTMNLRVSVYLRSAS